MPQTYTDNEAAIRRASYDDAEYPQVAYVNGKCINIVADLWHTPETSLWKSGAVTRSNEEACMMAATATWLLWREKMMAEGRQVSSPNFVISSQHSPIWDSFSQLWNIEMRSPSGCSDGCDTERLISLCDDDTICVIHSVREDHGHSDGGLESLDRAIGSLNAHKPYAIPIHIDAGDSGLSLPFTSPEMLWDFRLDNVRSISAYCPYESEVFPGTGFVCWRDRGCVPEGMLFTVSYLGTEISQVGLNFSRSTDGLLNHYARYVRLGQEGVRQAVVSRASGEAEH